MTGDYPEQKRNNSREIEVSKNLLNLGTLENMIQE